MHRPSIHTGAAAALALLVCVPAGALGDGGRTGGAGTSGGEDDAADVEGSIVVAGETMRVKWNDGDTFRIVSGSLKKKKARLADFNTLESYGPVHRWGAWTGKELYALAKEAGKVAAAGKWECTDTGVGGGYGRVLFACPELARSLVSKGLAHVFAVDRAAPKELLDAQAEAQAKKLGIWAKGVPAEIITSVHSASEGKGYNRVIDTKTGMSRELEHDDRYETCKEVCVGPKGAESCMLYVPFEVRYRDKPDCMR